MLKPILLILVLKWDAVRMVLTQQYLLALVVNSHLMGGFRRQSSNATESTDM